MRALRPNTFLVGSMKSGTTYLSGLLAMHPEIFVSSPREPCHFADPKVLRRVWPGMWKRGYWRSSERYLGLFASAGEAKIIAEGSTVYSQAPLFRDIPERILEMSPDARFIYIIRDPIERTISHYWHRVKWWRERRGLMEALLEDPHYLSTSDYASQLRTYLRHVARERVYVLALEELVADPMTRLRALFAWLGVDATFRPALQEAFTNPTPATVEQARGLGVLNSIRKSPLYGRIGLRVPAVMRKFALQFAMREVRTADVPVQTVEAYLRPIQLRQTAELSALLGRQFPQWTTLFAEPVASPRISVGDVATSRHGTAYPADLRSRAAGG
jgi:Sulfotransferase family